jgi:hypothetical protein
MTTIAESDIEPALLEALRELAASENRSMDEVANRVIKDGLDRLDLEMLERMKARAEF